MSICYEIDFEKCDHEVFYSFDLVVTGSEAREQALKIELQGRDKTIEDLNKALQGKDAV